MSCISCKQVDVVEPIPDAPLTVRFLCINDVYIIDNFANYATAKKEEAEGCDKIVGLLAGDFLAPSLLSIMDKGVGVVDVMNNSGVDYVCIGNHENDIKLQEMHKRIQESKFEWINSNMQSLPLAPGMSPMPRYRVIEVNTPSQKRRIGIIGLNTEDPRCVPAGRFGGCVIDPVNETAAKMYQELMESEKLDTIVPMTHQYMPEDRKLAEMGVGFPIIIGGHDHKPFNEVINGVPILKTGQNLENIGIVDIVWPNSAAKIPTVNIKMHEAKFYEKDPEIALRIKKHKYVLEQMEKASLFGLPRGHTLTTRDVREQPSTMAAFIFNVVRKILQADCVMICGGSIRADCDYTGRKFFTYADLIAEFTFPTPVIVLPIPGSVIVDTIQFTRAGACKVPSESNAFFMQCDEGVKWHNATNRVTMIADEPVKPTKTYNCVVNYMNAIKGLDKVDPLIKYVNEQIAAGNPLFQKDIDTAIELKHLLIGHFCKLILFNLLQPDKVLAMDENQDGVIDREEFRKAARKYHGEDVSDLLVNNLFNIADLDGDGQIDQSEIEALMRLANESYVGSTPVSEVFNDVSGWFSCLVGEIDKSTQQVGTLVRQASTVYSPMTPSSEITKVFSIEVEAQHAKKVTTGFQ